MTSSTKSPASTSDSPAAEKNGDRPPAGVDAASSSSAATLDQLAAAHEDLIHEIRQLVARQALAVDTAAADDGNRARRLVTVARSQLLAQLQEQQHEGARQQLAAATRSGEEAADGVVRSVTTIVGTIVPVALVRPENLIDAAYTLADQGLRIGRQLALSVSSSVRSLTTSV
jgi:hypothetical protein